MRQGLDHLQRGQKFDNKINLSNTTNEESVDANIAGSGNNVYVR